MMSGMTLFFVVVGVCVVTAFWMRIVEWLDTPRPTQHRRVSAHTAAAMEQPCAELKLEAALRAA